jgi:hypothetical protein
MSPSDNLTFSVASSNLSWSDKIEYTALLIK